MQKLIDVQNLKIEKDVPLPPYTKMSKSDKDELAKTLSKLNVGESIPLQIDFSERKLNAVRTKIDTIKKDYGMAKRRFSTNRNPVDGETIRVWRVL